MQKEDRKHVVLDRFYLVSHHHSVATFCSYVKERITMPKLDTLRVSEQHRILSDAAHGIEWALDYSFHRGPTGRLVDLRIAESDTDGEKFVALIERRTHSDPDLPYAVYIIVVNGQARPENIAWQEGEYDLNYTRAKLYFDAEQ